MELNRLTADAESRPLTSPKFSKFSSAVVPPHLAFRMGLSPLNFTYCSLLEQDTEYKRCSQSKEDDRLSRCDWVPVDLQCEPGLRLLKKHYINRLFTVLFAFQMAAAHQQDQG